MTASVEFAVPKAEGEARLRALLAQKGIKVLGLEDIPYGHKFTCSVGGAEFKVILYYNAKSPLCTKLVQQGGPDGLAESLSVAAPAADAAKSAFPQRTVREINVSGCRIGTDESGKGDFFGPLVAAGVYVEPRTEKLLEVLGVRDSKMSSDRQNRELARSIRELLPPENIEIVCLSPAVYNRLYMSMGNLNTMLGWAHARVIENLLARQGDCRNVIVDQFADEYVLAKALMPLGRKAKVLQTPKGERDTAVAAASILARDRFLSEMERLSAGIRNDAAANGSMLPADFILPKGAGAAADNAARTVKAVLGAEAFNSVAKLHFKNYQKL